MTDASGGERDVLARFQSKIARTDGDGLVGLAVAEAKEIATELAAVREERDRLFQDRYDLLGVKTTDGLSASEWMMRTAAAERERNDLRARSQLAAEEMREEAFDEAADIVALEVLCRVFDDGLDVVMEEWHAWYKPDEWLGWHRALGGYIAQRLAKREVVVRQGEEIAHDLALGLARDAARREGAGSYRAALIAVMLPLEAFWADVPSRAYLAPDVRQALDVAIEQARAALFPTPTPEGEA